MIFDAGVGLAKAPAMYDAARVIGEQVRRVGAMDREALEKDDYKFNVHLLLGGQVKGSPPELYMIYPQGNPLAATEDSPYLQIGETKYGRPILDRGIRFDRTTLEEAAKYALLSLDSTMKSNVTVGPPIDLLAYKTDELNITRQRRFVENDPDLQKIRMRWEQALAPNPSCAHCRSCASATRPTKRRRRKRRSRSSKRQAAIRRRRATCSRRCRHRGMLRNAPSSQMSGHFVARPDNSWDCLANLQISEQAVMQCPDIPGHSRTSEDALILIHFSKSA